MRCVGDQKSQVQAVYPSNDDKSVGGRIMDEVSMNTKHTCKPLLVLLQLVGVGAPSKCARDDL